MRAIANHFRIHLKYIVANPVFISGLIFITLIFLIPVLSNKSYLNSFIWPGLITPESLTLSFNREMGSAIVFLYSLLAYSIIPMAMIKTFPSNNNTRGIYVPTLPIGFRSRAVSETLLAMCVLFATRAATQFLFTSLGFSEILTQTMLGVLIVLPVSMSLNISYFKGLMPVFISFLVFVAVKLGFLAEPVSYIITCFVFSLFVYWSLAWQIPTFKLIKLNKHKITKLYRTPLSPEKQYLHDWWAFPLKANLVWVLVFSIMFCLTLFLMLIDIINYKIVFAVAYVYAISLGLIFAIRPFGLDVTSLAYEVNDTSKSPFTKIWYILPIRKHVMLRGMFFHVVLWGTVSCILFSFASLASSIYKSGGFNLFLQEFNWGKLVILNVFYFVPCGASFFVNIVTDSTSGILISILVFVALLIIIVLIYFSNVSLILAITTPMLIASASLMLCIPKLKANK